MPFLRALLLLTLAFSAVVTASRAQDAPICTDEKLFGDHRRFDCRIEVNPGGAPPRFVALFSGGHDDTQASMKAQVGGADIACGPGSKAELMGEDGNVNLMCHVPVGALPPGQHVFTFHVRWHHAQYEGYRLER